MTELELQKNRPYGVLLAVISYTLYGMMALYWMLIKRTQPFEILCHRYFWGFCFLSLLILFNRTIRQGVSAIFADKSILCALLLSGLILFIRLTVYYYALAAHVLVDLVFGAFIAPLLQIPLSALFYREKMTPATLTAFFIAIAAVVYLIVSTGSLPLWSLVNAICMAGYALARKRADVNPFSGLFVEHVFFAPLCLGYLIWLMANGQSAFLNYFPSETVLLIFAGIITTLPILFYAAALQRTTVTTMGFLQYLDPTICLFISIFVLKEAVSIPKLIAFSIIWVAILLYLISQYRARKTLGGTNGN